MIFQGTLLDLGGKFELNRLKNHDCFCLEGRHHLREALWARGTQRLTISLKKSGRHLSGISEQKKKQAHMEAAYEKRHPFFEILRFVRINRLHLWDWVKQVWGGRGWRCGWLAGIFVNMSSGRHFMECLEEKITELSINWPFHAQDPSLQFLWSWDIDYDQQSRERRKTKSLAEVGSKFFKRDFFVEHRTNWVPQMNVGWVSMWKKTSITDADVGINCPRCPFRKELCGSNDQLWVDATAGMAGMATAHPKGRAKAENEGDVATSSAFPHAGDAASSSSSGSQWVKSVHRTVGVFAEDSETSSMSDVQRRVAREHAAGTCNPCIFLASRQGCRFGEHCRFCHGVHPNRSLPAENTH